MASRALALRSRVYLPSPGFTRAVDTVGRIRCTCVRFYACVCARVCVRMCLESTWVYARPVERCQRVRHEGIIGGGGAAGLELCVCTSRYWIRCYDMMYVMYERTGGVRGLFVAVRAGVGPHELVQHVQTLDLVAPRAVGRA